MKTLSEMKNHPHMCPYCGERNKTYQVAEERFYNKRFGLSVVEDRECGWCGRDWVVEWEGKVEVVTVYDEDANSDRFLK